MNLLDNSLSNQPSKFRTKNSVEINDESKGSYSASSDIIFKTTMLRSNLCDYADSYILVRGTITITGSAGPPAGRTGAQLLAARNADERDKGVIFKSCAPFTKCISRINSIEIYNTRDIDIVMPMYSLI